MGPASDLFTGPFRIAEQPSASAFFFFEVLREEHSCDQGGPRIMFSRIKRESSDCL